MNKNIDLAWVERLRQMLIEKAKEHFQFRSISKEEFEEYLRETVFLPDWETGFIDSVYLQYLDEISKAADRLNQINITGGKLEGN